MPRITRVYTRRGDDGTTALGSSRRVSKDAPRIDAYGTVDELSSQIGVALAAGVAAEIAECLREIQNDLFHLGADLCVSEAGKETNPVPRIEERHVARLEAWIDARCAVLPPLVNFVLPGGAPGAAALHAARCVCRRAERRVVALAGLEPVGPQAIRYLNRLSDALFVMARLENRARGIDEACWDSRA